MKAAFLTGRMQIEVREIPTPSNSKGGALLKVEACGLCGSDINRIKFTESDEQRVIGHEVAGVVVTTDDDSSPFVPGDKSQWRMFIFRAAIVIIVDTAALLCVASSKDQNYSGRIL